MSSKFAIYQNISKIYSNKLNSVSFTRVFLVEQVKREKKREREKFLIATINLVRCYTPYPTKPSNPIPEQLKSSSASIPAATIVASPAKTS